MNAQGWVALSLAGKSAAQSCNTISRDYKNLCQTRQRNGSEKQPGRVTTSSAPLSAGLTLTPLQMLGVLLKIVLKNRVTDHEIDEICSTYYEAITKWFP